MKVADFVFKAVLYPWIVLTCTLGAIGRYSSGETPVIFMGAMLLVGLALAAMIALVIGLLEKILS